MVKPYDYRWDKDDAQIYKEIFQTIPIIDAHVHQGTDIDKHYSTSDMLIRSMNKNKIAKSIIFPLNDPEKGKDFHIPNEKILRVFNKHPSRFVPFCRLDPNGEWKDELELRLSQGFVGVKLHPASQKFTIGGRKAQPIYRLAEKHNLMVLIHSGFSMAKVAGDIQKLIRKFPNLKIILGHAAFVDMVATAKVVKDKPNVLFEVSTLKVFELYNLMKIVPPEQIIFGSDYPYYNQRIGLEVFLDVALITKKTPSQIAAMLGLNINKWLEPVGQGIKKKRKRKTPAPFYRGMFKFLQQPARIPGFALKLPVLPIALLNEQFNGMIKHLKYLKNRERLELVVNYLRIYSMLSNAEILFSQRAYKRAFNRFDIIKLIKSPDLEKEKKYFDIINKVARSILRRRKEIISYLEKGGLFNLSSVKGDIMMAKNICVLRILKN